MTNDEQVTIILDKNDAAIILKSDGTFEASLPDIKQGSIPDHVMTGAALAYALRNSDLCELIHANFARECSKTDL